MKSYEVRDMSRLPPRRRPGVILGSCSLLLSYICERALLPPTPNFRHKSYKPLLAKKLDMLVMARLCLQVK
jgi:hypothetical protein